MGFQFNTDFSTIEPNEGAGSFFPVSDSNGWLCKMVHSEGKENSKKTGQVLLVKLVGLEGPVTGKTHEYSINLTNENQDAARIGIAECSAIAHVTGHIRVGNSAEWHEKPFRVVVGLELDRQTKEPTGRNVIKKYLDVNGNGPKDAGKGAMGGGVAQQTAQGFQQNANPQQNAGGASWGNAGAGGQVGGTGAGQQFDTGAQSGGFSNGQTGQPNAQGGTVNPGSTFQPSGGQQQDPNAGQGFQQGGGNGFQQNPGAAQGGGWNR